MRRRAELALLIVDSPLSRRDADVERDSRWFSHPRPAWREREGSTPATTTLWCKSPREWVTDDADKSGFLEPVRRVWRRGAERKQGPPDGPATLKRASVDRLSGTLREQMQPARHVILQLAESRLTRRLFSRILGQHRVTLEMTSRASRKVASPRVICIEDLRPLARRRVPKAVFDYLDGGAEGEVTLRENYRAFEDVTFRPRHAVSISGCDLRARVLGFDLSLPFLLAPVGYSRLMHPGGEVAAARAAGKAGTVYILSTISGHKLEDVKAGSSGPVFYQLYLMGGRAAAEAVIERARVARFAGLVVTIDTPVPGIRERDYRNGTKELISGSLLEKIPFLPQVLSRPGWLTSFLLDGGLPALPNVVIPSKGPMPLVDINAALASSAVTWADLRWIRDLWRGPIVIKGVLTGDDARRAIDEGVAAISVSNHGGRQLDCVPASLRALPEVVAAVNGQVEVLMDGGIRRGTDIVKAICLGARAVLCGRAYAYGLAASGEAGIARAIEILRADLERTLRLLGCPSIAALDRSYVNVPKSWEWS